jgi:hypothetical protein
VAVEKSQLYEQLYQQLQAEVAADQAEIQQLQDRLNVTAFNKFCSSMADARSTRREEKLSTR